MGAVAFAKFHDGNLAAILILTFTGVSGLVAPVADKPSAAGTERAQTPRKGRGWSKASRPKLPNNAVTRAIAAIPLSRVICRAMAARQTILVFDSGLGGLTVYREVAAARPDADFLYVADDAAFPYGASRRARAGRRVVGLMGELIATHRPDLVVIACNTASTIVLPDLRKTIPAALCRHRAGDQAGLRRFGDAARIRARHRSDGAARIYPRADSRLCAGLRGDAGRRQSKLAAYAEAELDGAPASDDDLRAEIAPCFRDDGQRTDTIVLACTHYPLLIERLRQLAPWPVNFIDPAPAIARRVVDLLGAARPQPSPARTRAIFTSGRAACSVCGRFGIRSGETGRIGEPLNCANCAAQIAASNIGFTRLVPVPATLRSGGATCPGHRIGETRP